MGRIRPSVVPIKPSGLRGLSGPTSPASPTSPRTPLYLPNVPNPLVKPTSGYNLGNRIAFELPSMPMPWIWSCHRCHTRYLLGTTRRCLQDGHYFCGGTTVDQISGKVKKHKACMSEFDYTGWEDFGRWKKTVTGQIAKFDAKNCEDECGFPSSCRWKEQYVVQKTGTAHTDPVCVEDEPEASSIKSRVAVPQASGDCMDKIGRTAGERTLQVARENSSRSAEGDQNVSPVLETTPNMNGLGLHSSTMDLSSYKNGAISSREAVENPQIELWTSKTPRMSVRADIVRVHDVDMTGWIIEDASEIRSISHCAHPEATTVPFDFRFEQDKGFATRLDDDDDDDVVDDNWVTSMKGSALNWTVGGIGVALSPPDLPMEVAEMG